MKKIISGIALLAFALTGCEKKVDPIDGSNATVELSNLGKYYVTGDVTLNPKDSIYFSFTISSSKDMKYVSIQKNPVNQTAFLVRDTLNATNKNSYSAVKKFMADSVNGNYLYRIVAHDAVGNYIGHKDIAVNINADFNFYSYRFLYAPDSTAKTNKCYFSTAAGDAYSYADGASKSASIDFGYFYDTTKVSGTALGHTIYALNATGVFGAYDITSWTKNATIFKKLTSGTPSPTFAQALSAGTLKTGGISNLASGSTTKVTGLSTTSPNNTVYFKTASGKYGMIQINFSSVTTNVYGGVNPAVSYVNIDVKIEK
jgi:hypothetical protein